MINLLSQEAKINRKRTKTFRLLLYFFIFLLFLVASNYLTIYYTQNWLAQENANLTNERADIDLKILKYKDLETDITFDNSRLALIKSTVQSRAKWSSIITNFASLTPTSIQISSLSVGNSTADKTKGASYTINVSGVAKTLEDIEIYRKSLDDSGSFSGSVFKSASFNKEQSNFTFGLTTNVILNPAPKK